MPQVLAVTNSLAAPQFLVEYLDRRGVALCRNKHFGLTAQSGLHPPKNIDQNGITLTLTEQGNPFTPDADDIERNPQQTPTGVSAVRTRERTAIGAIWVMEGQAPNGDCDPRGTGQIFNVHIPGPAIYNGANCLANLIVDKTLFEFESPAEVIFGLAIVVEVRMAPGGSGRFASVGADYDVSAV